MSSSIYIYIGWWFQPILKIFVKMGSSSPNRGEHEKYEKKHQPDHHHSPKNPLIIPRYLKPPHSHPLYKTTNQVPLNTAQAHLAGLLERGRRVSTCHPKLNVPPNVFHSPIRHEKLKKTSLQNVGHVLFHFFYSQ